MILKNEELNVDRCYNLAEPDRDDLGTHLWRALPLIEETELGVISWHCCERCHARTLFDVETEDGFAEAPIVVYPPNCFDAPAVELWTNDTGITCPACAAPEVRQFDLPDPTRYRHAKSHVPGRTRCAMGIGPIASVCGCPSKASGDVVHLDGCPEHESALESAALMAERFPGTPIRAVTGRRLDDGRVSFTAAPEPASRRVDDVLGPMRNGRRPFDAEHPLPPGVEGAKERDEQERARRWVPEPPGRFTFLLGADRPLDHAAVEEMLRECDADVAEEHEAHRRETLHEEKIDASEESPCAFTPLPQ